MLSSIQRSRPIEYVPLNISRVNNVLNEKPISRHRKYYLSPNVLRVSISFISQDLDDSFNYGLFQPPLNGRAGKFLDEERRLSEYPFQGTVGQLEVSDLISDGLAIYKHKFNILKSRTRSINQDIMPLTLEMWFWF